MLSKLKRLIRRVQQSLELLARPRTAKAFNKAKKEGLFNLTWYEEHYGSFPHELAAFKDYLDKSTSCNVNPSAHFDTERYLRANMDLYLGLKNPLLHYMYHGKKEGRSKFDVCDTWLPSEVLIAKDTASWRNQKIAVVLHIFYEDFVAKFANTLKQFPTDIDVFVTASSASIKQRSLKSFNSINNVKNVKVEIAENRGRNFGPFLVNFSKDLLNYDLMCHMHSKKSLYSGREQTQWFDYLNHFMLKDKHVVKSLLRLFDEHSDLGVYYPTSFWMMPPWVNHWTCNKAFASEFVDQWGIDLTDNFINYPVGGMFWARPKALKPMLDRSYIYLDFPEEPLPNDGSWLHALERTIGLLAEKEGFSQFFYYPPHGKFTKDKSYISSSYYKPPENLLNDLRGFDIVSFDVFDTVLRRRYTEPDYAKLKLAKELVKAGYFENEEIFIKARNDAEYQCRLQKGFKGDVSIFEAYEKLSQAVEIPTETSKAWAEREFEHDLLMALPKDEMVKVVQELHSLGKEIWFVTDIYYTQAQIVQMLKVIGISVPYQLFVSSDLGKRKDAGTMWEHIKSLVDADKKSFVHVGDNVRSDAQICGDFGLQNMHILNPIDKWQVANLMRPDFSSEQNIIKWGKQISHFGRYHFFGE